MSWYNVIKGGYLEYKGLDTDEDTYLYDYPQGTKIRWHRDKASDYWTKRDSHRGKLHIEFADKMREQRKAGNMRFVLDMQGNVITERVNNMGKLYSKAHVFNAPPKPKKYPGGSKTNQALHDRFSTGAFTLEDMQEMHGKAGYRRLLLVKLEEAEGL